MNRDMPFIVTKEKLQKRTNARILWLYQNNLSFLPYLKAILKKKVFVYIHFFNSDYYLRVQQAKHVDQTVMEQKCIFHV